MVMYGYVYVWLCMVMYQEIIVMYQSAPRSIMFWGGYVSRDNSYVSRDMYHVKR